MGTVTHTEPAPPSVATMPVIGKPKKVSAGTTFTYSGAMDTWGGGGAYNGINNSCENIEGYGWVCKYSSSPARSSTSRRARGGWATPPVPTSATTSRATKT